MSSVGLRPGPILLLGAPGVGKGTQAKLLMSEFSIPQISTGDLLRAHRRDHTALGLLADDLMREGKLVPDELVNKMVATRLTDPDCKDGYVLDGFPRTLIQAEWLDLHLGEADPVVVISIDVPRHDLLRRVTGRRLCPSGHIFNVYTQPPQISGFCDVDGEVLLQRNDDTEAAFEQRMLEYAKLTAPVLLHYRAQGRFVDVDGTLVVEQVGDEVISALERLRRQTVPSQVQVG